MCGFCGEIRFDGRPASVPAVDAMARPLAARGPDTSGLVHHGPIAFGHRRLKIIDLSERAQQPMVDPGLGLSVVFNGTIYNHKEIRAELEERGYRFFSDGDTEVLLKAWHAFGEDALDRIRGMFAFALWSRDEQRLWLARDHLGIKPLYYAELDGALRFASSLPALLAAGGVDTDIDPVGLHHYLTFHAVVPAPHTILRGVRKLPPATLLSVGLDGAIREDTWWELSFEPEGGADGDPSFEDCRDRVLEALRVAVRRRLVADVPVGVLLSGGVDSSLVVGLLAEEGQHGLETFSIGFESHGDLAGDEFRWSDVVARRFETHHHRIRIPDADLEEHLLGCVHAMAEPMVSHDAIGFYLLSREVARHVRVVQSGQGADEVFAGYHWYPRLMESVEPVRDYARVFFDRSHDELLSAVHPRFHGADHSRELVVREFDRPGAESAVDKALRLDTTVMLVDDPVKRVDNMTMAFGLEARVPFLDRDLVELAAAIPARYKVAEGGKHVLKEAARRVIPSEVIDRPKGYFPVPALTNLRGSTLDLVRDVLGRRAARERALFAEGYVGRLLEDPTGHHTPLRGSKLWQVALLELWLQAHGI